jgi:hypothetical protein
MTEKIEMFNQGTTLLAMMYHTKIDGKNIYELFDSEGNPLPEFNTDMIIKFRLKFNKVKKIIHGNYDNKSPILLKKNWLGRALMMFRSWIPETVANRFESEKFDIDLQRNRKGRWLSYYPALKALLKKDISNLSDIDKANMSKNFMELAMLVSTYMLIALLKGLKDAEDDEEGITWKTSNYLINSGNRLLDDLYFYLVVTPSTVQILKSPVPAISTYDDVVSWFDAVIRYSNDDDIIRTGRNAGKSRLDRETMQLFPGLKQIPTTDLLSSGELQKGILKKSSTKEEEKEKISDEEFLKRREKNKRKRNKKKKED